MHHACTMGLRDKNRQDNSPFILINSINCGLLIISYQFYQKNCTILNFFIILDYDISLFVANTFLPIIFAPTLSKSMCAFRVDFQDWVSMNKKHAFLETLV